MRVGAAFDLSAWNGSTPTGVSKPKHSFDRSRRCGQRFLCAGKGGPPASGRGDRLTVPMLTSGH